MPIDDREWIAAYGPKTSLLTYHDIVSNNIDVLRSDTGGGPYAQISTAIPATDYRASNNQLGNIAIGHARSTPKGFYAYQSFVAPSKDPGPGAVLSGAPNNEAFVAVSSDGGHTFTDKAIPCSTKSGGSLSHQFPNILVAPNGSLVETWSNDSKAFDARSADHGSTWTCTGSLSNGLKQAVEPWVVASATGTDLVYYGTPDAPGPNQLWSVYLVQDTGRGFGAPEAGHDRAPARPRRRRPPGACSRSAARPVRPTRHHPPARATPAPARRPAGTTGAPGSGRPPPAPAATRR